MIPFRIATRFTAVIITLLLANCANQKPVAETTKDGQFVNPYPAGTYDNFKADPSYPKTFNVWKNDELLATTTPENSSIKIELATQRGLLMNGDQVVIDYPISSGVPSRPTPPGTYYILEKTVDKRSNKYGRIYNAEGDVVNRDADSTTDTIPEGGKFVGAAMPYWMRMTNDGIGHHIGPLPKSRRPASHACIRGPSATIPKVFSKVKVGTRIIVE